MPKPTNSVFSVLLTGALCAGATACDDSTSEDTGSTDYEALQIDTQPDAEAAWQSDHFEAVLFDALDSLDGQLSPDDTAELIEQVPLMAADVECEIKGMVIGQYAPHQGDEGGGFFQGRAMTASPLFAGSPESALGEINGEWSSPISGNGTVLDGEFMSESGASGTIHGLYTMSALIANRGMFDAHWTGSPSDPDVPEPARNGALRGTWRPFVQAPGGVFTGLWSECEPLEIELCPEGFEFHHSEDGWASCITRDLKLPEATGLAPHCADVNDGHLGFKWDMGTAQVEYECPEGMERIDNGQSRELCVWNDLALPPQDVRPACNRLLEGELGYRWRLEIAED